MLTLCLILDISIVTRFNNILLNKGALVLLQTPSCISERYYWSKKIYIFCLLMFYKKNKLCTGLLEQWYTELQRNMFIYIIYVWLNTHVINYVKNTKQTYENIYGINIQDKLMNLVSCNVISTFKQKVLYWLVINC